jgi:hypothetical protein
MHATRKFNAERQVNLNPRKVLGIIIVNDGKFVPQLDTEGGHACKVPMRPVGGVLYSACDPSDVVLFF